MTSPSATTSRPLLVVGDALLDRDVEGVVERLSPDAPVPVLDEQRVRLRPGGAGLAAILAAADGREVTLLTALADDDAGSELDAALAAAGVELVDVGLGGRTPEKIRFRAGGHPLLRLDRGGSPGTIGALTPAATASIEQAEAVLVSDYGRGVAAVGALREALSRQARRTPLIWDPHPRGPAPVPGAALATPNEEEALCFVEGLGEGADRQPAAAAAAAALAERWRARAVCVTRGAGGALLAAPPDTAVAVPTATAARGDSCGAGDRFAVSAAGLLADGAPVTEAVAGAVRAASEFVAAGGAATAALAPPRRSRAQAATAERPRAGGNGSSAAMAPVGLGDATALSAAVRAGGGTVVATGGCFDLLHAGHVRTLEAARALGDCLIVCLNSDSSVRRLKGPGRPLVECADRAAVLRALECVDAVAVFDEDTPAALLERLRPDVFAKGGDYVLSELPEREQVERFGGRAVVLPYLDGRSTTRLIRGLESDAGR